MPTILWSSDVHANEMRRREDEDGPMALGYAYLGLKRCLSELHLLHAVPSLSCWLLACHPFGEHQPHMLQPSLTRVRREVVLANELRVLLVSDTSDEPPQEAVDRDDGEVDNDDDENGEMSDDCSDVTDSGSDNVSSSSDSDSDCDRDGLRSIVRRRQGAHEVTPYIRIHTHTHTRAHTHQLLQ